VDGYGVHTYPTGDTRVSVGASAEQLEQSGVLSECKQGTKLCWLTECGFPNKDESCPLNDAARVKAAQAERAAFQQFVEQGRLAAILYYSWSGVLPFSWQHDDTNANKDPYTIFRCGALTDAGKAALNPIGMRSTPTPRTTARVNFGQPNQPQPRKSFGQGVLVLYHICTNVQLRLRRPVLARYRNRKQMNKLHNSREASSLASTPLKSTNTPATVLVTPHPSPLYVNLRTNRNDRRVF
jgi:hypothetical protein